MRHVGDHLAGLDGSRAMCCCPLPRRLLRSDPRRGAPFGRRRALRRLRVDLVTVLLGGGIRWFGELDEVTLLDDPFIVPGVRVTHLIYRVRR